MNSTTKIKDKNKDIFDAVYQVVRLIPAGKVTSYGAIANYLGVKSGARMVGWAMNGSHNQKESVPAHRVVNRNGLLSGRHHFNPPGKKCRNYWKKEGIKVIDHQIQNFDHLFWDPLLELK